MTDHSFDIDAESDPARIGLILPTSLGGVVQSLPVLPVLRERFREASLTLIVTQELSELINDHPLVDRLIEYDRRGPLRAWRHLMTELRQQQFDMAIDFHGLLRTGIMTLATWAPLRIGLETAREGAGFAYSRTLSDSGPLVPEYQRFERLAEYVGLGERRGSAHIRVRPQDRDWVAAKLGPFRRPLIAVHPGAGWATKRWPIEKFAVSACKTLRRFGGAVVVLGGEAEQLIAGHFADLMHRFMPSRPVLNLAGTTSLKRMSATLQQADCLLTNDSGPMHLAASLGTRVVGIFTCTSPVVSGPPGPQHQLVSTCVACRASYRKRCHKRGPRHMACMEDISTERVVAAMNLVLEERIGELRRAA